MIMYVIASQPETYISKTKKKSDVMVFKFATHFNINRDVKRSMNYVTIYCKKVEKKKSCVYKIR